MSDPTREEYDAKLAAVEARLEGRLIGMEGKLDRLFDHVTVAADRANEAKAAAERASTAAGSTKWNILVTALGAVAVLVAMYAILMQSMDLILGVLRNP